MSDRTAPRRLPPADVYADIRPATAMAHADRR